MCIAKPYPASRNGPIQLWGSPRRTPILEANLEGPRWHPRTATVERADAVPHELG